VKVRVWGRNLAKDSSRLFVKLQEETRLLVELQG